MTTINASDMHLIEQILACGTKQTRIIQQHGEAVCRIVTKLALAKLPDDLKENYRKTFPKDENPMTMSLSKLTTKKLEFLLGYYSATDAKLDEVLKEIGLE